MILINVKFTVRPEYAEEWLPRVEGFTRATRAEPGNVFFEWSQSVEDPNQFVLLEAFKDSEAGEKHVNSEHFRAAMAWMPEVIASTPQIINAEIPDEDWGPMGELSPRES
ncbi:putative quinol monooxygenase [Streptomyces varsoviensis]|uniref:Antibiotic biosynthesis monooxygenase n=1 Tax=Streptomyces varsoviensis TaxID=67373 RepID=A0ABR5IRG2_9ACTN|nr:antibiotic biosynthesis monooxygenase [Streptomyces varsoviensis]